MKNSYTVVVERDPESNWLVGEVVELPGCYTQAPDLPSLESNVREAISVYLKTASPEEPLHNRISRAAKRKPGISLDLVEAGRCCRRPAQGRL